MSPEESVSQLSPVLWSRSREKGRLRLRLKLQFWPVIKEKKKIIVEQ